LTPEARVRTEAPPPAAAPPPARAPLDSLGLIVPYAIGLVVASLFGRAFVPAATGTVRWSDQLLAADGFVAQALGTLSTALLAVLLVRASTSTRAVPLRIAVTVIGGFALLLAMTSSGGVRTPDLLLFATSIASGLVCVIVAASGERRLPEFALGLAGAAGFVRLVAVALTLRTSAAADAVATLGFLLELGVVGACTAFVLRARKRGAITIGVALAFALVATWLLVAEPEGPRWVMLRHAIEELAPRPRPLGPWLLAPVLSVLAVVLSIGLCVVRRAEPAVVGSLAIVALVRAHAEVPLLGMALTIGAVSLFLARAPSLLLRAARDAALRGNLPRLEPVKDPTTQGDRLAPRSSLD